MSSTTWTSLRLTWLQPSLCTQPASSRDQCWALIQNQPLAWLASCLVTGSLLSSWKGQHFVLTGITLTLDMDLPSLYAILAAKLSSANLQNALSWYSTDRKHCSWWKSSLHRKISVPMSPWSWYSLIYVSHHPEVADSIQSWMTFWRLSCSVRYVIKTCRAGARFF